MCIETLFSPDFAQCPAMYGVPIVSSQYSPVGTEKAQSGELFRRNVERSRRNSEDAGSTF